MSKIARDPLSRRHRFPAENISHAVWLYFGGPRHHRYPPDDPRHCADVCAIDEDGYGSSACSAYAVRACRIPVLDLARHLRQAIADSGRTSCPTADRFHRKRQGHAPAAFPRQDAGSAEIESRARLRVRLHGKEAIALVADGRGIHTNASTHPIAHRESI